MVTISHSLLFRPASWPLCRTSLAREQRQPQRTMIAMRQSSTSRWATTASAQGPAPGSSNNKQEERYFDTGISDLVMRRFPWLLGLMMVQSISGVIVDRYSALIERHIVLASFLTMLVGGGGNSSGQTIASLIQRLTSGEVQDGQLCRVLLRELTIGLILAVLLALFAYPRVLLLSKSATSLQALTISVAYAVIVTVANVTGVLVAMTLHKCGMAAVGSPPVVQVLVDVMGVMITMVIAQAILGGEISESVEGKDSIAR